VTIFETMLSVGHKLRRLATGEESVHDFAEELAESVPEGGIPDPNAPPGGRHPAVTPAPTKKLAAVK
jgi:hypothetical protein